jgi:hypothetical protein
VNLKGCGRTDLWRAEPQKAEAVHTGVGNNRGHKRHCLLVSSRNRSFARSRGVSRTHDGRIASPTLSSGREVFCLKQEMVLWHEVFFYMVLVASPFGLVRELKITSPFFRDPLLNLFTTFYAFASQCPPDVVLHEISIAIPVLEAQKNVPSRILSSTVQLSISSRDQSLRLKPSRFIFVSLRYCSSIVLTK